MLPTALLSPIWGLRVGGKTQLLIITSSHMQNTGCPLAALHESAHTMEHP